jgi:hypothetical protein
MPPPTRSIGRREARISLAASSTMAASGRARRAGIAVVPGSQRKSSGAKSNSPWHDVFGDIEDHRPRPTGSRDREGAPHQFGNASRRLDAQQILGGRAQDLDLARLLGHVLARVLAVGIADDDDLRHAGIEALDHRGDEVGRPRPQRRVAGTWAARHAGIGIGGEGAAALVVDEMVPQPERAHRLVEGQELESAHAEHRPDPMRLQHLRKGLSAIHPPRRRVRAGLLCRHVTPAFSNRA